jgi:hypothetical protein
MLSTFNRATIFQADVSRDDELAPLRNSGYVRVEPAIITKTVAALKRCNGRDSFDTSIFSLSYFDKVCNLNRHAVRGCSVGLSLPSKMEALRVNSQIERAKVEILFRYSPLAKLATVVGVSHVAGVCKSDCVTKTVGEGTVTESVGVHHQADRIWLSERTTLSC